MFWFCFIFKVCYSLFKLYHGHAIARFKTYYYFEFALSDVARFDFSANVLNRCQLKIIGNLGSYWFVAVGLIPIWKANNSFLYLRTGSRLAGTGCEIADALGKKSYLYGTFQLCCLYRQVLKIYLLSGQQEGTTTRTFLLRCTTNDKISSGQEIWAVKTTDSTSILVLQRFKAKWF